MKVLRKLSLVFTCIFFSLCVVLSAVNLTGRFVFLKGIANNTLLTVFSSVAILFLLIYLLINSRGQKKKWYTLLSVILPALTLAIVLFIGLTPQVRYSEYLSPDGSHKLIVEEKMTHVNTALCVYEETSYPFCKLLSSTNINKAKDKPYNYGDYTITLEDKRIILEIPAKDTSTLEISYAE